MKFLTSVCAFCLLAPACWAATGDPYVGLDLDIDQVFWKDPTIATTYPTNASGASLRIGDRLWDDIAVELGYTNSYGSSSYGSSSSGGSSSNPYGGGAYGSSSSSSNTSSNRLALRAFQLDSLYYVPLGQGWFQPFVTGGLAYDKASARLRTITDTTDSSGKGVTKIVSTPYFDSSEIDWRAGFGMEFVPADGFSLRFTARYEPYSFGGHMTGGTVLGLGLNAAL